MLDQTTPMPEVTTRDEPKAKPDTKSESQAKPSAPRLPAYVMHG